MINLYSMLVIKKKQKLINYNRFQMTQIINQKRKENNKNNIGKFGQIFKNKNGKMRLIAYMINIKKKTILNRNLLNKWI